MVEFFKKQGHEVSFLYSDQEPSDIQEMRNYFGKQLYVVSYSQPPQKKQYKWINSFLNKINNDRQYYSDVDDFYNLNLDRFIQELIINNAFDIVIAEYIFLSKSFLNFSPSTLKILDTHDVMTNRHRLFLQNGEKPAWYSTTAKQEKKGLDRANYIISIQGKERDHFSSLTSKPIMTIGHMVEAHPLKNTSPPRKRILFLGSNNPSNIIGIETFISKVFPTLKNSIPELELIVAGTISSQVKDQEGVIKMGEMPNLEAIYDLSDIVINPLTIGTGLKIKSIEALGFSKALICTSVGADGLEDGVNSAFLVANTPEEFCNALNTIIFDSKAYLDLCTNATKFVEKWNNTIKNELCSLLTHSH